MSKNKTQQLSIKQKAELEAKNGLLQYEYAIELIRRYTEDKQPFTIFPSMFLELQRIAVEGVETNAGKWRTTKVSINKSKHNPPDAYLIENLVNDMCSYINDNWHEHSAFHLSAYAMWRLNWIHPFSDGNGRTSRIFSYIILCIKLGYILPGSPTIPQQIQEDRTMYFEALEDADAKYLATQGVDLTKMEELIKGMLAKQLLSVIEKADKNKITSQK